MKFVSSIAFIICIAVVCFVQSDKPRNTLTELSKPTNLTCCSERGSVVWKHQQLNNDGVPIQICSGQGCNKKGYSIDNSTPGCFHLTINSTSIDAAGLYQCNEVVTDTVNGAYLVVYNFSCNDNFNNSDDLVEGDIVKFHCSMSWRGKWPFEIRWLNEHGTEMYKDVMSFDLNPFYSSSLEVNVSRPNFPPYTVQFAFLNKEITDPNVDKSCPSVNWSSPVRNVKYRPGNIKLSCPVERCERSIEDTINCSADGYPIPELRWLNWDDNKIASGSVLELKSLGTHNYKCVATTFIRGKNYETSKDITVNVISKPDIDVSECDAAIFCKVGLIVGITSLIVIVILVIVGVFAWRQIRKRGRSNQQQEAPPPQAVALLREKEMADKETTEGDKLLLPPGEQKDPNVQTNHKEYNNFMKELSPLGPNVTFRSTEIYQPYDSDTTEDERLVVVHGHPTHRHAHPDPDVASFLTEGTDTETEDKSTC